MFKRKVMLWCLSLFMVMSLLPMSILAEHIASFELDGVTPNGGIFIFEHGTAKVEFIDIIDNQDVLTAYSGNETIVDVDEIFDLLKITLIADKGYEGLLYVENENHPMPGYERPMENSEYIYYLPVDDIVRYGDNSSVYFKVDFVVPKPASIELSSPLSVDKGLFRYDNGTAGVMFVRGENGKGAYDGNGARISLNDDVTVIELILTAAESYSAIVTTGDNIPPVPEPKIEGNVYTYVFDRSVIKGFVAFNVEFIDENETGKEDLWHAVSWSGGNVTVENGTVMAERVHIGDLVFTVNEDESGISDTDNIYPVDLLSVEEGKEGLCEYGVVFGDSDIFIGNDVKDEVSIDFRFVPDYGYQLSDITTNGTVSLLGDFKASVAEISGFNFVVKPDGGNVHFEVQFEKSEDIVDIVSKKVDDAYIENGGNATDSGNLIMTVNDIAEENVSAELKTLSGGDALYLDMNLYQVVNKDTEDGTWQNQLENLDGYITVSLRVPAPEQGSSYYIVREHGNGEDKEYSRIEVEFVPDENNPTMGIVTFKTDRFSNYALSMIKPVTENKSEKVENARVESDSWTAVLPDDAKDATSVMLVVKDSNVSSESNFTDVSGVSSKSGRTLYVDLSLFVAVNGQQKQVKNLGDYITATLKVPAISDSEKYTVVREHTDEGGDVTYQKMADEYVSYDPVTSTLTIRTNKFSIYALFVSNKVTDGSSGNIDSTDVTKKPVPNIGVSADANSSFSQIAVFDSADDIDGRRRRLFGC